MRRDEMSDSELLRRFVAEGDKKARERAIETMEIVREKMHIG